MNAWRINHIVWCMTSVRTHFISCLQSYRYHRKKHSIAHHQYKNLHCHVVVCMICRVFHCAFINMLCFYTSESNTTLKRYWVVPSTNSSWYHFSWGYTVIIRSTASRCLAMGLPICAMFDLHMPCLVEWNDVNPIIIPENVAKNVTHVE